MKFKVGRPNVKINKQKIIKVVVAGAVLAGIVILVVAVAHDWKKTQNKQAEDAQKVASAQAAKDKEQQRVLALAPAYDDAYQNERINCEKGKSIYDNILTPVQKKAVDAKKGIPTCGPAVLPFTRD